MRYEANPVVPGGRICNVRPGTSPIRREGLYSPDGWIWLLSIQCLSGEGCSGGPGGAPGGGGIRAGRERGAGGNDEKEESHPVLTEGWRAQSGRAAFAEGDHRRS